MPAWNDYSTKDSPNNTDTLMIKDETGTGKPNKRLSFANLAKFIIEKYTGSTIGGVAQSIKAAVDTITNKLPYNVGNINITTEVITRTLGKSLSSYSMMMISYYVNANTFLGVAVLPISQFKTMSRGVNVYHQNNINEYATVTYVDDTHITAVTTTTGNRYISIMLL